MLASLRRRLPSVTAFVAFGLVLVGIARDWPGLRAGTLVTLVVLPLVVLTHAWVVLWPRLLSKPVLSATALADRSRRAQLVTTLTLAAGAYAAGWLADHQGGDSVAALQAGLVAVFATVFLHLAVGAPLVRLATRRSWDPATRSALPSEEYQRQRLAGDDSLELLFREAEAHLAEGNDELMTTLFRQALNDPRLSGMARGATAARLGWGLAGVGEVEQEWRDLLAEAQRLAPHHVSTGLLGAYIACEDGDPRRALRSAATAQRDGTLRETRAHVACLQAVAHHLLGEESAARRCRAKAERVWPECDLLAWADRHLGRDAAAG